MNFKLHFKLVFIYIVLYSFCTNAQQINVAHSAGMADGNVSVEVVDYSQLTGDNYEVNFDFKSFYRDQNGNWLLGSGGKSIDGPLEIDTLTGSSIGITAYYGRTSGEIELQCKLNLVSPDYDWADGISMTFPSGVTVNGAPEFQANNGDIVPVIVGNTVLMGNVNHQYTQNGPFIGDELWSIYISNYSSPITVDWIIYDDAYSGGPVDAEGNTTINQIEYLYKIVGIWNLKNLSQNNVILENLTVIDGYDLLSGESVENPTVDGLRITVDVDYNAPKTLENVELNGAELNYSGWWESANFTICDFTFFGLEDGYANTSLPLYGGAGGTLDSTILQQDYELRWTGTLVNTVINGNLLTITQSGGSIITLFGASGYDLADHPLNPYPGVDQPFTVRVPFEIWNLDNDQQVNAVFWDRSGDPTVNGGAVWNQSNREYIWIVNTPYSPDIIDETSQLVADNATWNLAIYKSNFTLDDVVKIIYKNPVLPGVDKFTFNTFDYPSEITHDETFEFTDYTETIYYKILGIPGNNDVLISNLISGTPGKDGDWRAFWDPGTGTAPQSYIEYDGTSTFNLTPGRAFWVLSKNPIDVQYTTNSVSLDDDFCYSIPVHSGWNLISNPFDKTVPWSDVKSINGVTDPIHNYQSGSYDSTTNNFAPYKGYYFYNRTSGLTSLKIPYVSPVNGSMQKQPVEVTKGLEMVLSIDGEAKSGIKVGFSEEANPGLDKLDIFSPPSAFCNINLAMYNQSLVTEYKYLNKEYRNEIGNGQEFEIELKNTTGRKTELKVSGLESFDQYEIYLVDKRLNTLYNLRNQNVIEVKGTVKSGNYSLLIGTKKYIEQKKSSLLPGEFVLYQNYPNPFNPSTTIRFALPVDGNVTLNVYNILGELVTRLINNIYYPAGYHETDFDGKSLTSGVYLYTIQTGNFVTTKKMIFIK